MALVMDSTVRIKQFYRQSFEIKQQGVGSLMFQTLVQNPDDMSQDEPARATVTQTLGGAFVTDFGQGLPSVVLSGTTGYKKRINSEGQETDGFQAFRDFRNKVYRDFITQNDPTLELYWYNWEDEEYYQIQPTNFRLQRNKTESLLYRYEFRFTCLRAVQNAKQQAQDWLVDPRTDNMWSDLATAVSASNQFITNLS